MSKVVKCVACNANIEGRIVSAMGNTYHPEHFVCTMCKEPITDEKFQVKDGLPYCNNDYTEHFLSKCHACKEPIRDRVIKALGHDWHQEHFICALCKTELASVSFTEKDGEPVCQQCYSNNFTDKCRGCGQPLVDKIIIALNEKWHPDCFKCCKCSKPVAEETFQVEGDRPLCSKCA